MRSGNDIARFENIVGWQKAHLLVLAIYRATDTYPKSELFSLTQQMRRAAVSVAANIAEGSRRRTEPDKIRFLSMAQGSLDEVRYYLLLSRDLGYLKTDLNPLACEVSRLLTGYIQGVQKHRDWRRLQLLLEMRLLPVAGCVLLAANYLTGAASSTAVCAFSNCARSISESTIICTSCLNVVSGAHPRAFLAFVLSPIK